MALAGLLDTINLRVIKSDILYHSCVSLIAFNDPRAPFDDREGPCVEGGPLRTDERGGGGYRFRVVRRMTRGSIGGCEKII